MADFPTITVDETAAAPPVVNEEKAAVVRPKLPVGATWNEDGSVTLPLAEPVRMTVRSSGGDAQREYGELRFGRIKGRQLLGMMDGGSSGDRTVALIAASTGLSPLTAETIINEMDARDLVRAIAVVGVFTGSGPTTGQ